MANYSILDGQITSNIYTNGVQAITGAVLQGVLLNMVTSLGKHYQLGGVALPAGVFTAGDENVAFLATEAGTYTNYGGFTLDGKTLHVLAYKGTWTDTDTLIPTGAAVTQAISAALANYAKKDGIEPALVAGTAASLLGAPVEKIFQAYVARQSGRALIDQLKGNAIVWNQILQNDLSNPSNYITNGSTTANYDGSKLTVTFSASGSGNAFGIKSSAFIAGHKYFILFEGTGAPSVYKLGSAGGVGADGSTFSLPLATTITIAIPTGSIGTSGTLWMWLSSGTQTTEITAINIIDITLLGIDSLTTAAEVETWLQQNIGSTGPFGFNAGTVLPFCASSLQAQSGTEDLPLAPQTWEDTDGNLIYPHGGMFAAGSAFDFAKVDPDGYIRKGTRVFGVVNLGTLNWTYTSGSPYNWMVSGAIAAKSNNSDVANFITKLPFAHYSFNTLYGAAAGENGIAINAAGKVVIRDSAYTDPAAFKTAMSGVMLYYELATPVEKTLAQPVNVLFVQAAGENVSLDPANGSTPYTAAARMDLREPDAVSAGTLQNLLEALKTAGVISAYTMTWDAASGTYQFTVTA